MAKSSSGMHKGGGTKARGRTKAALPGGMPQSRRSHPKNPIEMKTETNRPIGAGPAHRGDRRDTSRPFTNNSRRQVNHSDPLGSGKKQIQGGGKALKSSRAAKRRP